MEQNSTHYHSKENPDQLSYSPEQDEFLGIEEFKRVFDILDEGIYPVNEKVLDDVLQFADTYPNSGK